MNSYAQKQDESQARASAARATKNNRGTDASRSAASHPASAAHGTLQAKADRSPRVSQLAALEERANQNRTGMPDQLKTGLEQLSGQDLSDVRVHYNSPQPAQLMADAYAQGTDIHLGPGQERHLPHEGWHTVQQMQGRVQPTMQAHGAQINDSAALEKEADVMGKKATQVKPGESAAQLAQSTSSGAAPVQRTLLDRLMKLGFRAGRMGTKNLGQNVPMANYSQTSRFLSKNSPIEEADYVETPTSSSNEMATDISSNEAPDISYGRMPGSGDQDWSPTPGTRFSFSQEPLIPEEYKKARGGFSEGVGKVINTDYPLGSQQAAEEHEDLHEAFSVLNKFERENTTKANSQDFLMNEYAGHSRGYRDVRKQIREEGTQFLDQEIIDEAEAWSQDPAIAFINRMSDPQYLSKLEVKLKDDGINMDGIDYIRQFVMQLDPGSFDKGI